MALTEIPSLFAKMSAAEKQFIPLDRSQEDFVNENESGICTHLEADTVAESPSF